MATEIAEGGQATLDAFAKIQDASLPFEDRFNADFTDHDPGSGQPAGPGGIAWYWEQFGRSFTDIEHEVIDTAHKESMAKLLNLSNRGDQLKAALHEKVDEQVAKSK